MKKETLCPRYRVPRFVFLSMTLLCWSMTLFHSATERLETAKAVPAFQNETISSPETITAYQADTLSGSAASDGSFPLSDAVTAFQTEKSQTLEISSAPKKLTRKTAPAYCQSLARQLDSESSLLSSHSDADYSDFYFYSPVLEKQFQMPPVSAAGSNLQIVFVWNRDGSCKHIYLGIPWIEYCF